jgi:flagellar assembly protein FliH
MARYVFRPGELRVGDAAVFLRAPFSIPDDEPEELEELSEAEAYSGPTVEEMRSEAEAFKKAWEIEKETLEISAKHEADEVINRARAEAEAYAARREAECRAIQETAEAKAADIIANAERRSSEVLEAADQKYESGKKAAEDSGRETGWSEGYEAGKAEVERLISRLHTMLERVQDRRQQILDESEQQIVDLSLLVARKVVKSLVTADHKNIVSANVSAALQKLRSRGIVTIKVNLADLEIASSHKEEFTRLVETAATGAGKVELHIHEDSSVDQGGCIVETDFGEIDARISAQLSEIESRILEISPLKHAKKGL